MVFFVLSGWLISSSVLRAFRSGRWSWRPYLARRLTRLWIVLLPALVLGFAIDHIGIAVFHQRGVYGNSPEYASIVRYLVHDRTGLTTLVGNALFLQTIRVPTFGSNAALWSLAYEFWYYMMFPLRLLALTSARSWNRRVGALVLLGAITLSSVPPSRLRSSSG